MFEILLSLVTLTILEIVLGVDNLVFLAIITQKLPPAQQPIARKTGLILALVLRLVLLAGAVWIIKLTFPLFTVFGHEISGRDLFLLGGGMFLLAKATQEIHEAMDPKPRKHKPKARGLFTFVVIQIALLDLIFSLDSVLTAIGLTDKFWLMATAIIIAIACMLFLSEPLSRFVHRYPSIKMLALSFLILIGMVLVADGMAYHIPRGYVYFAMGFSIFIEFLNMIRRRRLGIHD